MSERSARVVELLSQMTVEEKAEVITGGGIWTTRAVERLGIPSMTVTDGPNGARGGGLMGTGTPTACIPAGSVLGATWDVDLMEALGGLLGDESQAKGANVLLAPTINLHRNPLGGRNFECYSEDPLLTGRLATAFTRGVQSRNVAVTLKHFVGNDSEFERNSIDTQADERTLREVYLLPFEHAVTNAAAWGIMSSYNRLNGTFASEHNWLLDTVLRQDWGFDGFVISDWYAVRSTGESIRAGLSLEMPGEGIWYGPEKIKEALAAGTCDEADLDRVVGDVLTVLERTDAFDGVGGGPEKPLDRPEDRALIRQASVAGTVLIRNEGLLPLDASTLSSVAVIGPNARAARIMGGGSAAVRPYHSVSPLDALSDRLADATVTYAQGCTIDRTTPPIGRDLLAGSLQMDFYDGHDLEGEIKSSSTTGGAVFTFFGVPSEGVTQKAYSLRLTGTLRPQVTGEHVFKLVQSGRSKVLINGEVLIDATEGDFGKGDEYFGMASAEIPASIQLEAGTDVAFEVQYSNKDAVMLCGAKVGVEALVERDLLGEAEAVAAEADVAIVVVGTNDDWETEGRDRDQFELPGDQTELIKRVSAVNDKTIVVVNTGGPHDMSWLEHAGAVMTVGFGGQELGDALVDVLLGDADPGGRMNTTVPARYEHSPAYLNYPGENSVVRYGEGLYIGHRFFDARHIEPAVPFGHGLSYASFDWTDVRVSNAETTSDVANPIVVEVDVTNTSDRAGSDVVQIYVEPGQSLLHRPLRELKGFAKVHLGPGETATATVTLDRRAFAYFDPGDQFYANLPMGSPVPRGQGNRHTEAGWYVDQGEYTIRASRSSRDHASSATVTVTE